MATIAIYTGGHTQPRPCEYKREVLDTSLSFRYRTYHIFDHTESELLVMDNAFALIVLACQKALLEGRLPEAELGKDRLTIARAMLRQQYDKDRITSFLIFLKNFLYINNSEINRKFDQQIIQLSGGTIDMGGIENCKETRKAKRPLGRACKS